MPRVFEIVGRAEGRITSLQDLDDLLRDLRAARRESLRNGSERHVIRRSLGHPAWGGEIEISIHLPAADLAAKENRGAK